MIMPPLVPPLVPNTIRPVALANPTDDAAVGAVFFFCSFTRAAHSTFVMKPSNTSGTCSRRKVG